MLNTWTKIMVIDRTEMLRDHPDEMRWDHMSSSSYTFSIQSTTGKAYKDKFVSLSIQVYNFNELSIFPYVTFAQYIYRVWRYCTKNWPRENPHHYICYRSHTNLHVVHIQTWNSIPCDSHEVSRIHHRLCVVRSIENTKCIK